MSALQMAPITIMTEWTKILISALSGVATGTLLEPIKQWTLMLYTASRMKRAIYRELGDVYYSHVLLKEGTAEYHATLILRFKSDAFNYYYDTHREAFYRFAEWRYLVGLYEFLNALKQQVETGQLRPDGIAEKIAGEFSFRFTHSLIKKHLVEKYAKQIQQQHQIAMRL